VHLCSLSEVFSDFANCGIGLYLLLPASHCLNSPEGCELFPNGSLEGCVLNADMDAQLGGNIFSKDSGFTSTKGQFTSCILSAPLTIKEGSKFHNCLPNWWVSVKFLPDGNQSVSCWRSHLRLIVDNRGCGGGRSSIRKLSILAELSDSSSLAEEIN